MSSVDDSFEFINHYAPEHLIIASEFLNNMLIRSLMPDLFLGNYCPESAGDYASGTNHTLPTNGWARSYSGINLDSFLKNYLSEHLAGRLTKTGP